MALMKTGRRGVEPTKKGEDPKKKNGVEPSQKQYTWEDVAKNEEIKSRNKAAREKYQSDIESYGQSMKKYTGEAVPTASSEELSMINAAGSKVRGSKSTFTGNKDLFSAAKENEDYEKSIKSGKYVDIDDPRIDAKTRYYLKGAAMGLGSGSDVLGKRTGKVAVPIEKALGKEKPTKWGDIYGGKDFDPYEFDKAAKSGNIESYMSKKGISFADMNMTDIKAKTQYEAPKKPYEPTYEKEENISLRQMPSIDKMRTLKKGETFENIGTAKNVGKVVKPVGKLSIPKKVEEEKPTWEDPSRRYMKTKFGKKIAYNVSVGEAIGSEIGRATNSNKLGSFRASKAKGKFKESGLEYNKQRRQFKAYYGAPSSISGSDLSNMTADDISRERESLKGVKKSLKADIRKTTPQSTVTKPELRAELRNVRKDIRATNKAERYAAGNIEARSIYPNGKEEVVVRGKKDASYSFFPPELGDKYSAYSKSIKSSTDNAANRNTIANQEKGLSFKQKVQASKDRRQNAPSRSEVRTKKAEETRIQKSIKIPK